MIGMLKQQMPTQYPGLRNVSQLNRSRMTRHEDTLAKKEHILRFRRFCVLPHARQLLSDGLPIGLGSRALDLLIVLLEARGTLVTKDEIVSRVWPSITVEESNLRVQMTALRAVLGEDRELIKTVPGRGYMFALECDPETVRSSASAAPMAKTIIDTPSQGLRLEPTCSRATEPPTVAIIDDDRAILEALQSLLRSVNICVELFTSVQEFLRRPRLSHPDCLVLDVRLPGQNGLDFFDDLIKADVRVPVIFISGHADIPMSVRAMKSGAIEFLTKPVRHQDLLDAIGRATKCS
jgi:DNA-binding response OmpR family regulator